MKKRLLITFLIIFAVLTIFADSGNFYWYRSSAGDTANAFPDVGEDSEEDGENWNTGDWVLFAVDGILNFSNGPTIFSNGGLIGSNSTPENKNNFSGMRSGGITLLKDFRIGAGQIASDVIEPMPGWLQADFVASVTADGFQKLPKREEFINPADDFPLTSNHFNPEIFNHLQNKEDIITDSSSEYIIKSSGNYNLIQISNGNKLKVEVGEKDLVIKVNELSVAGGIEIQKKSGVENTGNVFFYINDFTHGHGQIGNLEFADKTFFFYTGDSILNSTRSSNSFVFANVYLLQAGLNVRGSGGFLDVVSISENDILFGWPYQGHNNAGHPTGSIFASKANLYIKSDNPVKEDGGFVTGGDEVKIGAGNQNFSVDYIYAPNADISFKYDNTFQGSYIGRTITISNTSQITIKGPPHGIIEKPVIKTPQYTLHNLELEANPAEAETLQGEGTYLETDEVNIIASARDYYHFRNWTNEEGEIISENSDTIYTIPNKDSVLTANFYDCSDWLVNLFVYPDRIEGVYAYPEKDNNKLTFSYSFVDNQYPENQDFVVSLREIDIGSKIDDIKFSLEINGSDKYNDQWELLASKKTPKDDAKFLFDNNSKNSNFLKAVKINKMDGYSGTIEIRKYQNSTYQPMRYRVDGTEGHLQGKGNSYDKVVF